MNRAQRCREDSPRSYQGSVQSAITGTGCRGESIFAVSTRQANPWSRWGGGILGCAVGFLLGKYRNIVIFAVDFCLGNIVILGQMTFNDRCLGHKFCPDFLDDPPRCDSAKDATVLFVRCDCVTRAVLSTKEMNPVYKVDHLIWMLFKVIFYGLYHSANG